MNMSTTSPAEAEAARANTLVGYAIYIDDVREWAPDGTLTHGLRTKLRTDATRSGNASGYTKKHARELAAKWGQAYIVRQSWDAAGRAWRETVVFECTPTACKRVAS